MFSPHPFLKVIRVKLASMARSLESTYAWYESIVSDIEQAAVRLDRTSDGSKDYANVYSRPEIGARLAFLKVQAGKVSRISIHFPHAVVSLPPLS